MRNQQAPTLTIIVAGLFLGGCVTTTMQGYADRELPTRPLQHLAAYVAAPPTMAPSINSSLVEEARKRGIAAEDALALLPPTRTYTDAEVRKALETSGVDGVLVITVGDTGVQREYAGTYFSANYSGTSAINGSVMRTGNMATFSGTGTNSGTMNGFSAPTYRYSRQTAFNAKLLEPKTGRTLWVGNGQVNAGGRLFVGDSVSSSSAIAGIFEDLQKKGIIGSAGT